MPFESIENLTSFLFDDTEPIITTPEEMKIYNEIYLDFERCLEPEPITTFGGENTTVLSGAMAEAVEPVATLGEMNTSTHIKAPAGEAVEHPKDEHQLGVPSSPYEVIISQSTVTESSMKGCEKNTEASQWPDLIPEAWTTDVKVPENGSSTAEKDQVIRSIGPSK
ncbi:hypothetical protein MRB53_014017 [Persea americana]|uniref:Uncharacterized protein n=1 Tax=Persea americana TaxID=3435 RepID=A0ACC2K9S4_PERAE|nr:hypothetical protein MRB53_014017 [Persea americana]